MTIKTPETSHSARPDSLFSSSRAPLVGRPRGRYRIEPGGARGGGRWTSVPQRGLSQHPGSGRRVDSWKRMAAALLRTEYAAGYGYWAGITCCNTETSEGEVPALSDAMGFTSADRSIAAAECPGGYWIVAN